MEKIISVLSFCFFGFVAVAQNVGVGTTNPAAKLDVNGSLNVSGQLKLASDSGAANQVLTKNAANMPIWADLNHYKNFVSFACSNTASSAGSSNCIETWTVPAGVTALLVECWGGGGGGSTATGGNGGGYIVTLLTVVPGNVINMTIGAGGIKGTVSVNGIIGGTTTLAVSGTPFLQAFGGPGGRFGDPADNVTIFPNSTTEASYAGTNSKYIIHPGEAGKLSILSFGQVGSTDFARIIQYGKGGNAGNLPHSGGTSGYRIISTAVNQLMQAVNTAADFGGGGGADAVGGGNGRGGRVIIRW